MFQIDSKLSFRNARTHPVTCFPDIITVIELIPAAGPCASQTRVSPKDFHLDFSGNLMNNFMDDRRNMNKTKL